MSMTPAAGPRAIPTPASRSEEVHVEPSTSGQLIRLDCAFLDLRDSPGDRGNGRHRLDAIEHTLELARAQGIIVLEVDAREMEPEGGPGVDVDDGRAGVAAQGRAIAGEHAVVIQ